MASSSFRISATISLLLFTLALLLQTQISNSLTCSSQSFSKNRLFQHCNDLPHLKAYLHYTYNSSKSTLNLAFIAPPSTPNGWIAWAINPTSTKMKGSQALMALKQDDGSMTVKTFNISSYEGLVESKIAFEVSNTEAEYVDGVMKMYATVVLPKDLGTVLNQVWQVGGSVNKGSPAIHGFTPANLNSFGKLDLTSRTPAATPAATPTATPAATPTTPTATPTGGDSNLKKRNDIGAMVVLLVMVWLHYGL